MSQNLKPVFVLVAFGPMIAFSHAAYATSCIPSSTQSCVSQPCDVSVSTQGTSMMDASGSSIIVCVADGTSSTGYRWRSMNSSPSYLGTSNSNTSPQRPGDSTTGLFSDTDPTRANSVSIATKGVERMTVDSNGYVGIGTSAPAAPLDIGGWLRFMTGGVTDGPDIYFNAQGLLAADTNMYFNINGNGGTTGQFIWETGGLTAAATNLMHLDSDGLLAVPKFYSTKVGIGTKEPTAPLQFGSWLLMGEGKGNVADGPDIRFSHQGLLAADTNIFFNSINGGGFYWKIGGDTVSATTIMSLNSKGFLGLNTAPEGHPIYVGTDSTNGNGAKLTIAGKWTDASDRRSKENIRPIQYGLDAVMMLKPVAYEMKITHEKQIGLVAQDVEPIIPEAVSVSTDGKYGLTYGNLVAVAIRAIQEQQAEIAALKQEKAAINDLRARLQALEARVK